MNSELYNELVDLIGEPEEVTLNEDKAFILGELEDIKADLESVTGNAPSMDEVFDKDALGKALLHAIKLRGEFKVLSKIQTIFKESKLNNSKLGFNTVFHIISLLKDLHKEGLLNKLFSVSKSLLANTSNVFDEEKMTAFIHSNGVTKLFKDTVDAEIAKLKESKDEPIKDKAQEAIAILAEKYNMSEEDVKKMLNSKS